MPNRIRYPGEHISHPGKQMPLRESLFPRQRPPDTAFATDSPPQHPSINTLILPRFHLVVCVVRKNNTNPHLINRSTRPKEYMISGHYSQTTDYHSPLLVCLAKILHGKILCYSVPQIRLPGPSKEARVNSRPYIRGLTVLFDNK